MTEQQQCVKSSLVLLKRCLLWLMCSLNKTLLAFGLLYFVLQDQTCLLLQVSLDFLLFHSNLLWWKAHLFFGVSSRTSCQSSQNWSTSATLASVIEAQTWITVILNGLPWKRTKINLFILRLDRSTACLVNYEGYFISSQGFLPTVVDITVIWIKFTHSRPF